MNYRIFFLIIVIITSCNSDKQEIKSIVKHWHERAVNIPDGLEPKILGQDTIIDVNHLFNKEYCILTFFDTLGCTECNMKLYEWSLLIKETAEYNADVNFVFIVHSKNFDAITAYAKKNKFNHIILYDKEGLLSKANEKLPSQPGLQTFLLDRERKVKVIGNPLRNETLWELYKEQIGLTS